MNRFKALDEKDRRRSFEDIVAEITRVEEERLAKEKEEKKKLERAQREAFKERMKELVIEMKIHRHSK